MRFILTIVALASVATAVPGLKNLVSPSETHDTIPADTTLQQANDSCGDDLELHCCNKESGDDASAHGGLLGDILSGGGGLSLFDQCSSLQVPVLAIANGLVKSHCPAKVACCQRSPTGASGGLVNLGLPCIALAGIL